MTFKAKKGTLFSGIFLIALAVFIALFLVLLFWKDGADGIVVVTVFILFFLLPMAGIGIWVICNYKKMQAELENALDIYGEAGIVANVERATMKIYRVPSSSEIVYFTDRLIVDAGEAIIDYNEISMMSKYVTRSRYSSTSYIAFYLLSGKTYYLCAHIKDEEINEILQICYQRNPDILWGLTKENKQSHKQRVGAYKNGEIILPKVRLYGQAGEQQVERKTNETLPTPSELTPGGRAKENAKRVFDIGILFCLFSIAIFIVLLLDIEGAGYNKIVALIGAAPNMMIGLFLAAFGRSKLKKAKEGN